MFHRFANPARFLRLAAAVQPWAAGATVVLLATGLVLGLVASPADYQQGETVRIMYVHVPSAWMAIFCYSALAGACAVALIWKHPLAGLAARATAPIGAAFTFLALVTGSLWGKPMWGTWWVWDARLTSTLILWIIYVAYLMLRAQSDAGSMRARYAAVLGIVGFLNIPFIHFSVLWWRTFHPQPKVITNEGIGKGMDPTMLATLGVSLCAFTLLYFLLMGVRVRQEKLKYEIDRLKREKLYSA